MEAIYLAISQIPSLLRQSFFLPAPPITEKNCPDQTGRVHLISGGYGGCGYELARILHGANATVWIAGRSQDKAEAAMSAIHGANPDSKGALHFLRVDLSDLTTIQPAAEQFLAATGSTLHVLTNNAGVMMPPKGSQGAQGYELQMVTNCMGPFLLTKLLLPALRRTAKAESDAGRPPGDVRVTWAGSLVIDVRSPRGGVQLTPQSKGGSPKVHGPDGDYGQSKAGNLFIAHEAARRAGWGKSEGIVHSCWNPGNLASDLTRHLSLFRKVVVRFILHPVIFGAYTELYCAVSPDFHSSAHSGEYVAPWGRLGLGNRPDVLAQLSAGDHAPGVAAQFFDWLDTETAKYLS